MKNPLQKTQADPDININAENIPDKTPLMAKYHRKKTRKESLLYMLYFLNFVIKLIMTLVVYAVATYFVDACIFFACSNGVYECRNFCDKIWVVTLGRHL